MTIIIKNSKELAKLVDKNKDLILKDQDVRIEYQVTENEIRNVYCQNLFLMNNDGKFDFNGGNFNGRDFNGWNFNGRNFNGWDFNGENISYYGWFIVYKNIRCKSIIGKRENCFHKCLDGRLIIKSEGKSVGKIEGEIIEEN